LLTTRSATISYRTSFKYIQVFFFQAEDGIRDGHVTGVQTCALPIYVGYIGVQRNLGAGTVVDISYVGSQSRHLARKTNLNSPDYGTTFKAGAQDPTKYANGAIPSVEPGLPAAYASAGVSFSGAYILPTDFLRPYQRL